MADFADMMRHKLRLGHEIEQRIQAHGRLEHEGRVAEADLARLVFELQTMEHQQAEDGDASRESARRTPADSGGVHRGSLDPDGADG